MMKDLKDMVAEMVAINANIELTKRRIEEDQKKLDEYHKTKFRIEHEMNEFMFEAWSESSKTELRLVQQKRLESQ